MTPEAPYEVIYEPHVERAVAGLPAEAVRALSQVIKQVASEPETGTPYDARWPPEFRTIPFGNGGLVVYIISHRLRRIMVEDVTWV